MVFEEKPLALPGSANKSVQTKVRVDRQLRNWGKYCWEAEGFCLGMGLLGEKKLIGFLLLKV